MWPFVAGSIDPADFAAIIEESYATPTRLGPSGGAPVFADDAVTPLDPLGDDTWLLELFHGPTLAFKDVALQLVGRLFDHELRARATASRSSAPRRATPARRPSRPAATATPSTS